MSHKRAEGQNVFWQADFQEEQQKKHSFWERKYNRMDEQYSWKRTEDIDIDLADLVYRFFRHWKQAAACVLLTAVLFAGYGWLRDSNLQADSTKEGTALTQEDEQAVTDALKLEKENEELKTYLDNSLLMKLNPYQKATHVMLYCIDYAQQQELPAILESYLNFILNGGAAQALQQEDSRWNIDKSYLAEVLSAYQKTYETYYLSSAENLPGSGMSLPAIFYVEVTGSSQQETQKLAGDMQEVLKEYSAKIVKQAGKHRLRMLNSMERITADSSLQALQRDKRNQLSANETSLKAITDTFSLNQEAAYRKAAGTQTKEQEKEDFEISGTGGKLKRAIKYACIGLLAGMFLYGSVFFCRYILDDRIKSTEEIRRRYAFPVYGEIKPECRKTGNKRLASRQDAYGHTGLQAAVRMKLACRRKKVAKLCVAADFPLASFEKECLKGIVAQLKEAGIEMSAAEHISADTAAWDSLAETGNVLLVCRIGTTTHQMLDSALNFYLQNGISLIGVVVFLQD